MVAVTKWVTAGFSAAVLAGGLMLGGPAAVAATDDPACVQASGHFAEVLGAYGITAASVVELEEAASAAADAHARSEALREAAAGELWAQLRIVDQADDEARPALLAAEEALRVAQASGNATAISSAEEQLAAARAALAPIEAQAAELMDALGAALSAPEVVASQSALDAAYQELETLRSGLGLDEASAHQLVGLADQVRDLCGDLAAGPPVVDAGEPVAAPEPVPTPPASDPVAVNPGLNMDTAVSAEAGGPSGAATAGLPVVLAIALIGGAAARRSRSGSDRA
ncbi:hypothetical protein RCG67_06640 [Kocuria sp. CPCC 205292]|uniref:hypothetical protein n=1 Tax=Kocuria cellulosilytica TaxID=3071451 RepID=UPI0034D3F4CE